MATVQRITPDANGIAVSLPLDIAEKNSAVIFDLTDGWDYGTVQLRTEGAVTLGSFVNKIQRSNDGATPIDFSTAVTLSTATITEVLRVTSVGNLHSTFTTAGSSGNVLLFARFARRKAGVF